MGGAESGDQHHLANACKLEELEFDLKRATDGELATLLVAEMPRTGITLRM